MSNGYRPQPLDLFTISKLPRHLEKLVDLLAKNAHDVWASARISEGWTYGRAKVLCLLVADVVIVQVYCTL